MSVTELLVFFTIILPSDRGSLGFSVSFLHITSSQLQILSESRLVLLQHALLSPHTFFTGKKLHKCHIIPAHVRPPLVHGYVIERAQCACVWITRLFSILNARSNRPENSSPFGGIRCAPDRNSYLRGSKVQLVSRSCRYSHCVRWLGQIQTLVCSLPLAKNALHSHTSNKCLTILALL